MAKKENNNENQNLEIRKRDYLTTEKINLGNFSANKLSDDLKSLEVAEKDTTQPSIINENDQEMEESKEMLALKIPMRNLLRAIRVMWT